jgi:hypothetical protein
MRRELRGLLEGGGKKKEKRKKGKKGKRKKRQRIPFIIDEDLWVCCLVVCVAFELDNPSNVEELGIDPSGDMVLPLYFAAQ